jgi:hypothetical protein
MTVEELREEYKKETEHDSFTDYEEYGFSDAYVHWLEQQLITPCKSCQELQGQVNTQDVIILRLKRQLSEFKDHFNY